VMTSCLDASSDVAVTCYCGDVIFWYLIWCSNAIVVTSYFDTSFDVAHAIVVASYLDTWSDVAHTIVVTSYIDVLNVYITDWLQPYGK
jgi:hypothetical protein